MQRTLKTQDFPASLHLLAQCAGTHLLYLEVGLMLGVVNLIILPFSCSTPGSYFSSLFTQCYVSTVISLLVPHDILIGSFILRLIFLGLWTPPPSSTPCVELMFTHAVVFQPSADVDSCLQTSDFQGNPRHFSHSNCVCVTPTTTQLSQCLTDY